MHLQNRQESSEKLSSPLDIVRVNGQYRVGKLLGTGASGELNSDSGLTHFLSLLGSVYSGKDIFTGADVAHLIEEAVLHEKTSITVEELHCTVLIL